MRAKSFADGSNQEEKTHPEFEQHQPINFDPKLNKKGKEKKPAELLHFHLSASWLLLMLCLSHHEALYSSEPQLK